jgi:alcohol dehydrogenase
MGPGAPRTDARGDPLREGDRVTWAIFASDPEDPRSRAGIPQKAADLFKYGHERVEGSHHLHGGLADYCLLRRNTPIVRIDGEIPLPVAALINCSGATVSGALRLAGVTKGKRVLITGAGMLGMFATAMVAARAPAQLVVADIKEDRLQTAREFGATDKLHVPEGADIDRCRRERGLSKADILLDFSGVPEVMESSLECLDIGGTAVWVGATFPQRDLAVNAEHLVRRIHTIRGLHNYNAEDLVTAVSFMEKDGRRFPFHDLVHDGFPLEKAEAAFRHALASKAFRVGIRIGHHA